MTTTNTPRHTLKLTEQPSSAPATDDTLLVVADLVNGLLTGSGADGTNGCDYQAPEEEADQWRYIRVNHESIVTGVDADAVRDPARRARPRRGLIAAIRRLFTLSGRRPDQEPRYASHDVSDVARLLSCRGDDGRTRSTLESLHTYTTYPVRTVIACAKIRPEYCDAIVRRHLRGSLPAIKSLLTQDSPFGRPPVSMADSDTVVIEIEHDRRPVMGLICQQIIELLGPRFDIASQSEGAGAIVEITMPRASPELAHRLTDATDELTRLLERLHTDLGVRIVLKLHEANAVILRVLRRIG